MSISAMYDKTFLLVGLLGILLSVSSTNINGSSASESCGNTAYPLNGSGLCLCSPSTQCLGSGCSEWFTDTGGTVPAFYNNTDSSCRLMKRVFSVTQPSYSSAVVGGNSFNITWTSSQTLTSVDIRLVKVIDNSSPVPMFYIARGLMNLEEYMWNVPDTVGNAGDFFRIVVLPENTSSGFAFSPLFAILDVSSGNLLDCSDNCSVGSRGCASCDCSLVPIPTTGESGVSLVVGDRCPVCARGEYATRNVLNEYTCVSCPGGTTTDAVGSFDSSNCNVGQGTPLSAFVRIANMTLSQSVYARHAIPVSSESCARICSLDERCQSFDFETCSSLAPALELFPSISIAGSMTGRCSLIQESYESALPNTFAPSAGINHYEKINRSSALEDFQRIQNAFVPTPQYNFLHEGMSREACGAQCLHTADCFAFQAGVRGLIGQCILLVGSGDDLEASLMSSHVGFLESLDFYRRGNIVECEAGSWSTTGSEPGCRECPPGSYSSTGSTRCTTCPNGQLTRHSGSTNVNACEEANCPSRSTGPDSDQDCLCDVGAMCSGSDSCQVDSVTGVHYFKYYCDGCSCSPTQHPPTIDFVRTPETGSVVYWGQQVDIDYQVSNSVGAVHILLFQAHPSLANTVTQVGWIAYRTPATGTFIWTVPQFPERDDYVILIFHAPDGPLRAPTHRNTGYFSIRNPSSTCEPGSFNEETGAYPCADCPMHTYWVNETACNECPNGTRTVNDGSTSLNDCRIEVDHALYQFNVTLNTYNRAGAAAGYHLEEIDHKTEEECARLCLDDAGCKAFVSGVPDQYQAGDCFMQYDDWRTTWPGAIIGISQLNYWEKNSSEQLAIVSETEFEVSHNCYIREHDDGGIYQNAYTPETCAQLCLNDVCCKSFDAGSLTGDQIGHCFLSYEDQESVQSDYICDSSSGLNYYDRKIRVQMVFQRSDSTAASDAHGSIFNQLVGNVIASQRLTYVPSVTTTTSVEGYTVANVYLRDVSDITPIASAVRNGDVSIVYPQLIGDQYRASFTDRVGPCDKGTVSQTGHKPGCQRCRSGTFANSAQTICHRCPAGTDSVGGATSVQDCFIPHISERRLFNVHDEFVGQFYAPDLGGGKVVFRVTNVSIDGLSFQMIASFTHGLFCDRSRDCRTEGLSEFYYSASINETHVSAEFLTGYIGGTNGWVGITDRGFRRAPLNGTIQILGSQTTFAGSYGSDGTFNATKRCSASSDRVIGLLPGDLYRGHFECDAYGEDGIKVSGERDIQVASLIVGNSVDANTIVARVELLTENGTLIYDITGSVSAISRCQALQLTPTGAFGTASPSWQSEHPEHVIARQWSGYISEDGEHFEGILNLNPHCHCLGTSPYPSRDNVHISEFCGRIGEDFCWTTSACPEAIESSDYPGFYYTHLGPFRECTSFSLSRVCQDPPRICPVGWTEYNFRCYKVGDFAADLYSATSECNNLRSELTSVHSELEFEFIATLLRSSLASSNGVLIDQVSNETMFWLGLSRTSAFDTFTWDDGSQFIYQQWGYGQPNNEYVNGTSVSTTMLPNTWSEVDTSQSLSYVCKRSLLGVPNSCDCIGIADVNRQGDRCLFWSTNDKTPWCYVSQHCSVAHQEVNIANVEEALWRAPCSPEDPPQVFLADPDTSGFPCSVGSFLDVESSTPCQSVTICEQYEVEAVPPSITSDRSCVNQPTASPTAVPSQLPSKAPSKLPSEVPSRSPSRAPTSNPPTEAPSQYPSSSPTCGAGYSISNGECIDLTDCVDESVAVYQTSSTDRICLGYQESSITIRFDGDFYQLIPSQVDFKDELNMTILNVSISVGVQNFVPPSSLSVGLGSILTTAVFPIASWADLMLICDDIEKNPVTIYVGSPLLRYDSIGCSVKSLIGRIDASNSDNGDSSAVTHISIAIGLVILIVVVVAISLVIFAKKKKAGRARVAALINDMSLATLDDDDDGGGGGASSIPRNTTQVASTSFTNEQPPGYYLDIEPASPSSAAVQAVGNDNDEERLTGKQSRASLPPLQNCSVAQGIPASNTWMRNPVHLQDFDAPPAYAVSADTHAIVHPVRRQSVVEIEDELLATERRLSLLRAQLHEASVQLPGVIEDDNVETQVEIQNEINKLEKSQAARSKEVEAAAGRPQVRPQITTRLWASEAGNESNLRSQHPRTVSGRRSTIRRSSGSRISISPENLEDSSDSFDDQRQ